METATVAVRRVDGKLYATTLILDRLGNGHWAVYTRCQFTGVGNKKTFLFRTDAVEDFDKLRTWYAEWRRTGGRCGFTR